MVKRKPSSSLSIHQKRIMEALRVAFTFSQSDGGHHKAWAIDQMVRKLTGPKYKQWVKRYEEGDDGPKTYQWDTGIAP